jgi:hypothetical protein
MTYFTALWGSDPNNFVLGHSNDYVLKFGLFLIMNMMAAGVLYYPYKVYTWRKEGKLIARGWVYRSKDPAEYQFLYYLIIILGFLLATPFVITGFRYLLS